MKLTSKEEKFVLEYPACGFNAKEAAIRAGYNPKYASQQGYRVLQRIKPLIQERQKAALAKAEGAEHAPSEIRSVVAIASLEQSLQLCTALAFYDPRKLYEGDNLKSPSELTRRQALMITGFDVEENFTKVGEKAEHTGYTKKVKLVDRAPYLNMLLKWHRAFADKQPAKAPSEVDDLSHWTAEDLETYKKLKAKLRPTVIDGHTS